jgi:hypothetical protein
MSNRNTGGPAFPYVCDADFDYGTGMLLRDYFAAKAMQSFTLDVGWKSDQQWFDGIAEGAYLQADAMLKARSK